MFRPRSGWNSCGGNKSPERHQQLARQGDDRDALDAAAAIPHFLRVPDAQGAGWLVAQPDPGNLHHDLADWSITGFGNSLLIVNAAALPWRRREAGVRGNLSAVSEVAEEGFIAQY